MFRSSKRHQKPKDSSDELRVVVFHQEKQPRTFFFSLSWIHRFFGTYLVILLTLAGVSIFAIRLQKKLKDTEALLYSNPEAIQKIELSRQEGLKNKTDSANSSDEEIQQDQNTTPLPVDQPFESFKITSIFTAFPKNAEALSPQTPPSVKLLKPDLKWKGQVLSVTSALQYALENQGRQQGKLFLLYRGKGVLFTSPPDVLTANQDPYFFHLERAEYFSVSRYREIKDEIDFGRFSPLIQSVDFYIFDRDGKLILAESVAVPNGKL